MLKKFLFLIITVFFTSSALELEIAEVEQDFFDAYDTYIPANPVSVSKAEALSVKHKLTQKVEFKIGYNFPFKVNQSLSKRIYIRFLPHHPPSTILLQKSELRV